MAHLRSICTAIILGSAIGSRPAPAQAASVSLTHTVSVTVPARLKVAVETGAALAKNPGGNASSGLNLRIDATLRDLKHQRSVPFKVEGLDEKDLPGAVDQLAHSVQENLNVPPSSLQEMRATAFKPSRRCRPFSKACTRSLTALNCS